MTNLIYIFLGIFFQKNENLLYFGSSLQQYKKTQTSTMNFMFILLCELFIVSKYDEINCDFVFGVVFDNVF